MTKRTCSIEGCGAAVQARGLCQRHYDQRRHRGLLSPLPCPRERFWGKVDVSELAPTHNPSLGPCWEWGGCRNRLGYGRVGVKLPRSVQLAHRVAYEMEVGPIPDGLELDHLCRNPPCVRPSHLEPVTHRTNMARGNTFGAANLAKTHCKYGHPFDETNTYVTKSGGRMCRSCANQRNRDRYRSLRAG